MTTYVCTLQEECHCLQQAHFHACSYNIIIYAYTNMLNDHGCIRTYLLVVVLFVIIVCQQQA